MAHMQGREGRLATRRLLEFVTKFQRTLYLTLEMGASKVESHRSIWIMALSILLFVGVSVCYWMERGT